MTAPTRRPRIARSAIAETFLKETARLYPPILGAVEAANLLKVPIKTVRNWLAEGRLDSAARKRGRRWLIWRDALIDLIFNGENW